MNELATKSAVNVWTNLNDGLTGKLKVTFEHPHHSNVLIFIEGEIPH